MNPRQAAYLKDRIVQACGAGARDVVVIPESDINLQVSMKVHDIAAGVRLWPQVKDIPELAPYGVSLKMQVEP
jgi:hypothetical protein